MVFSRFGDGPRVHGTVRRRASAEKADGGMNRGGAVRGWIPVTSDGLIILGFLAVVLAPMALALAVPSGSAVWELITFLCCAFAAWSFIFSSNLLIAITAWVLAWACAMVVRRLNRRPGAFAEGLTNKKGAAQYSAAQPTQLITTL